MSNENKCGDELHCKKHPVHKKYCWECCSLELSRLRDLLTAAAPPAPVGEPDCPFLKPHGNTKVCMLSRASPPAPSSAERDALLRECYEQLSFTLNRQDLKDRVRAALQRAGKPAPSSAEGAELCPCGATRPNECLAPVDCGGSDGKNAERAELVKRVREHFAAPYTTSEERKTLLRDLAAFIERSGR